MAQSPQSYLPPAAQPWGRYIEKSITDINETARLAELNTKNNLKQLNSSVSLLARQQNTLEDQQLELAAQQDTLEAQQTTLANQQTQLTAQQNTLAAQQAYLATFQTYTSTSPGTATTNTVGSSVILKNFNNTFTLSRTSVIQIVISAGIYGNSYGNSNPSAGWFLTNKLLIPNPAGGAYLLDSSVFGNSINVYMSGPYYGGVAAQGQDGRTVFLTLPAGTYTLTAQWAANVQGVGGTVQVSNASSTVSVIG